MTLAADALVQRDYKTMIDSAGRMLPAMVRGFAYALEKPDANWLSRQDYRLIMAALHAAARVPLLAAAFNDTVQERALQEDVPCESE